MPAATASVLGGCLLVTYGKYTHQAEALIADKVNLFTTVVFVHGQRKHQATRGSPLPLDIYRIIIFPEQFTADKIF